MHGNDKYQIRTGLGWGCVLDTAAGSGHSIIRMVTQGFRCTCAPLVLKPG